MQVRRGHVASETDVFRGPLIHADSLRSGHVRVPAEHEATGDHREELRLVGRVAPIRRQQGKRVVSQVRQLLIRCGLLIDSELQVRLHGRQVTVVLPTELLQSAGVTKRCEHVRRVEADSGRLRHSRCGLREIRRGVKNLLPRARHSLRVNVPSLRERLPVATDSVLIHAVSGDITLERLDIVEDDHLVHGFHGVRVVPRMRANPHDVRGSRRGRTSAGGEDFTADAQHGHSVALAIKKAARNVVEASLLKLLTPAGFNSVQERVPRVSALEEPLIVREVPFACPDLNSGVERAERLV